MSPPWSRCTDCTDSNVSEVWAPGTRPWRPTVAGGVEKFKLCADIDFGALERSAIIQRDRVDRWRMEAALKRQGGCIPPEVNRLPPKQDSLRCRPLGSSAVTRRSPPRVLRNAMGALHYAACAPAQPSNSAGVASRWVQSNGGPGSRRSKGMADLFLMAGRDPRRTPQHGIAIAYNSKGGHCPRCDKRRAKLLAQSQSRLSNPNHLIPCFTGHLYF